MPQAGYPTKTFVLEMIRFTVRDRVEYRFGCCMVGNKPGAKGRWVWAQFAPFIPKEDFRRIVRETQKRGWW